VKNVFLGFLVFIALQVPVHAADKIRIGFPEFNSSTFTLPLANIKGFFNEEGLQAELIRMRSAVVLPALTIDKLSEKIQIMVVPQGGNFLMQLPNLAAQK